MTLPASPLPEWPLAAYAEALVALAEEASALLLRMQPGIVPMKKPDGSFVTEADTASNTLLCERLRALTPHIPLLAEENSEEENRRTLADAADYWTIDPLDVTGNYVQGGDGFSVNLALIRNHAPLLGVLSFPGKGEMYYTDGHGGAFLKRGSEVQKLEVRPFNAQGAQLNPRDILSIALRERGNEDALHTKQNKIRTLVTTGQHRACLVARGDALMSSEAEGFRAWDSAPTAAILRAAGGELRQSDGRPLDFRDRLALPEYIVGHPTLLDRILPPPDAS